MILSVVVLNYKAKNLTKQCIKNIRNSDISFEYEIIVVDNNSQDGTADMMKKEFPDVKFIQSDTNSGMGGGNNLGIQQAKGKYILIANSDIVVFKDSIQKLVDFAEINPRSGIIAPQVLNPDKTRVDTCCRWPKIDTFLYRRTPLGKTKMGQRHLDDFSYKDKNLNEKMTADWIFGCCFLVRRQALDEVGMFDETFFLFLEETDLCRRMWQKDWQVWYYPEPKVVHYPHRRTIGTGSIKDLFSKYTWIHLHSWIKYFWKWRNNHANESRINHR